MCCLKRGAWGDKRKRKTERWRYRPCEKGRERERIFLALDMIGKRKGIWRDEYNPRIGKGGGGGRREKERGSAQGELPYRKGGERKKKKKPCPHFCAYKGGEQLRRLF